MAQETKFTKEEVKFLYRAFKQECPNGIIDEDTFKEVYAKIFPLGDATKYAHLVFTAIDKEKTGGITFGDFMDFLSIISKGSPKEKILWSFHFYDVNRDGQISKEEMVKVIFRVRTGVSILMSYGENPHYVKLPIFSEFMENSAKFMKNSGLTKWTQNLR